MNLFKKAGVFFAIILGLMVGQASAAVPVEVTTAATNMIADAAAYGAAFIPVTVGVMVAFVGIKWVKKFLSKAS